MIYLTLPYMYENYKFNNYLNNLAQNQVYKFKKEIKIESYFGSFPWSPWTGDINSNSYNQLNYISLFNIINQISNNKTIILDCSNCLLNEKDYFDIYQNLILKLSYETSIYIAISDLQLYKYIKNKYPNYKFILSNKINQFFPLLKESKILQTFLNNNDFLKINISNTDIDKISNNKNHFLVTIGECNNCSNYNKCLKTEQTNQLIFSTQTQFNNCLLYTFPDYLKEIETCMEKGFNHFKISPIKGNNNLLKFNLNLLKNLIKEEYYNECLEECIEEGLV